MSETNLTYKKELTEQEKQYTKISIVIDTDMYAGNFETELFSYCTGLPIDEFLCEKNNEKIKKSFVKKHGEKIYKKILNSLRSELNEDRGYTCFGIEPTPGYYNDGNGNIYKNYTQEETSKNIKKYDAYQSVEIFFKNNLDNDIIYFIKERAFEFSEANGFNIIGFRLKETTIINRYREL